MDPQQRILLEVVAEAFNHAGIDPAVLDKERTGVFVGASSADHSTVALQDPSEAEAHFMLGNTLSILANRISYTWDLRGPSLTIDTACSSSLAALNHACAEIKRGNVDTAIVAGVNLLLSPIPFIGFSQAGMLSPSGLCRPFSGGADGYVRSEGAVVFILQRASVARDLGLRIRSELIGTGINSAGRGSGITVPSAERQSDLISEVLASSGASVEDIGYLEAHGTGTAVGDPIEAWAIGHAIGRMRAAPLPIGSLKSNFGHLEPASGLAGLLKAQLILENGTIPPTIHVETLNPSIDFVGLNLDVVRKERPLEGKPHARVVGVNSFGFGGVNAHALLREVEPPDAPAAQFAPPALLVSAATQAGLKQQVARWKEIAVSDATEAGFGNLVANANWNRERFRHRLSLTATSKQELAEQIDLWMSGALVDKASIEALGDGVPLAFVFSGNGAVWVGMAKHNYLNDPSFRVAFGEMSSLCRELGGADLCATLFAPDLQRHLGDAAIAQPIHYAIQIALVRALAAFGVKPAACLGHSLGEVAAAVASGAISSRAGMQIVLSRAHAFESLRDTGTIAALATDRDIIIDLIQSHGLEVDLAADNAPGQVTVSGPADALGRLMKIARRKRIAGKTLDLPYPYHSRLVLGIEDRLRDDLDKIDLTPRPETAAFYSGCLAERLVEPRLDSAYWLKNAIQPVEFRSAVRKLCDDGFRLFQEITPQTLVGSYVKLILEDLGLPARVLESLDRRKPEQRSATAIARRVLDAGGRADREALLGGRRAYTTDPPSAQFDRKHFRIVPSAGPDIFARAPRHPLLGARSEADTFRWRSTLSLTFQPWLGDHRVFGRPVLPATAVVEMFLQAAREVLPSGSGAELRDVEFLRPIEIAETAFVDILTEYEPSSRRLTLSQRVGAAWQTAAIARAFPCLGPAARVLSAPTDAEPVDDLYNRLRPIGLEYGPSFALLDRVMKREGGADAILCDGPSIAGCVLDPASADAGLHPLALMLGERGLRLSSPMVPSRIGRVSLCGEGAIRLTSLNLHSANTEGAHADVDLCNASGGVVVRFEELRLRPIPFPFSSRLDLWTEKQLPVAGERRPELGKLRGLLLRSPDAEPSDIDVLRAAIAARLAWDRVERGQGEHGVAADETTDICMNWLVDQGYLRLDGPGPVFNGPCPWPLIETLVLALADVGEVGQGELPAVLQTLAGLDAARPKVSPLPSLLSAVGHLIEAVGSVGHVALVGQVSVSLATALHAQGTAVTVVLPDAAARDALALQLEPGAGIRLASVDEPSLQGSADLVLGVSLMQSAWGAMTGCLGGLLTEGGTFASLEERPDLFAILTGRHRSSDALDRIQEALAGAGLQTEISETHVSEAVVLLAGERDAIEGQPSPRIDVYGEGPVAEQLRSLSDPEAAELLQVAVLEAEDIGTAAALVAALRSLPDVSPLWIFTPEVARFEELSGWRRTLANELGRDLRLCAASPSANFRSVARMMLEGRERELRVDALAATSPRIVPVTLSPSNEDEPALRLCMERRGLALEGLRWGPTTRRQPGNDEVEIAVTATGLNFRDVMWGQGLIPPEGLEGGYSGQGLGMECAGHVVRAGEGSRLEPGQRVAAFAPHAFATHVTVPASATFPLPEEVSDPEGAAVPVIFLTADYALRELARLEVGEIVLIHGGAGGVGLAAVQIAKAVGARIFATAGTPAKRRYLEMLGAEAVFDSRNLSFVDAVLVASGGRGADVILNSLAGEALELGISCLAPFGRFVELGKRDILANSSIALRAFKNNISLMAVDVDQLLAHRPEVAQRVMGRVADGLRCGSLRPPPITSFPAHSVGEAFQLMQQSGHIGKIVVRAPKVPEPKASPKLDLSGTWLVTGGTSGFGLATAEWLVANGARQLWLISRSGELPEDALARLLPAQVHLRAIDVTNAEAMEQCGVEIASSGSGLDGVIHSAGVIRDDLFHNLDQSQIDEVLRPKIEGAANLDRLARRFGPQHFWLFSSVSARFGNPRQAPYVAANRALEGLADRRRSEGYSGLAIAWGPIADVGMLSRAPATREALEQQLGAIMPARQALDRLGEVLRSGFAGPMITVAPMEWGRLSRDVAVLGEPLFEFVAQRSVRMASGRNLSDLVAELGEAKAREQATTIVLEEMARILRCAPSEIDCAHPMAELGFDSLMAMNLRLAVEERLGIELPIQALAAELTPGELVYGLFQRLGSEKKDDVADYMQAVHLADAELAPEVRERILLLSGGKH